MVRLDSARLKHGRATEHLAVLAGLIANDLEPVDIGSMLSQMSQAHIYRLKLADAPARLGLLVGDVLQNLRSSLDHAAWELADPAYRTNAGKARSIGFPIAEATPTPRDWAVRMLPFSRTGLKGFLEDLQPWMRAPDQRLTQLSILDRMAAEERHRLRRVLASRAEMLAAETIGNTGVGSIVALVDGAVLPEGPIEVMYGTNVADSSYPGVQVVTLLDWLSQRVAQVLDALEHDPLPMPAPRCALLPDRWRQAPPMA